MTQNTHEDGRVVQWSVVAESADYLDAEIWDDDELWDDDADFVGPPAPPSNTNSSVETNDSPLIWKWVLTENQFEARPDHGGLFHAQILAELGVAPGDGITGTLTIEGSTISYIAYDLTGAGVADDTRARLERGMLRWAESGGVEAALNVSPAGKIARASQPERGVEGNV